MGTLLIPDPVHGGPPPDAEALNPFLWASFDDDIVTFYTQTGPILVADRRDALEVRVVGSILMELNLASAPAIGEALGCHPQTVRNSHLKYQEGGFQNLVAKEKGGRHKGPRSMAKHLPKIQKLLNEGMTVGAISKRLGLAYNSIFHHVKVGALVVASNAPGHAVEISVDVEELEGPATRAIVDQTASEVGVAVKRTGERGLASLGLLGEAAPRFEPAEAVPGAGVLLALPRLVSEGLFEVTEKVYGNLEPGFYGLRSILLLMVFMALLRIKTPEQLERWAPGELGRLLGLDRAPEVKTYRRKLRELADRGCSGELVAEMALRYSEAEPETLSLLYIDGHVQTYDGRKLELLKTYVARRKRCQRGEKEYWVNDLLGRPVFFVLSPTNEGLVKVMDRDLLPEIRRIVGKDRTPLLVFDREGWSPTNFEAWWNDGFDILTYRKGAYEDWPIEEFETIKRVIDGKALTLQMATRRVWLRKPAKGKPDDKGFSAHEIRFLDGDTQVPIVTTDDKLDAFAYKRTLSSRWRQENFFRYMRMEFAFDHSVTRATDPEDPEKLVTNPARKEKDQQLQRARVDLASLEQELGTRSMSELEGSPSRTRRRPGEPDEMLIRKAERLRRRVALLEEEADLIPRKVRRGEIQPAHKIVRRESERKRLMNAVKMVAYRAESWLFRILDCLVPWWTERDRAFLQAAFQLPGDILPDMKAGTLTVRLHPPSTWRWKRGLVHLCEAMTRLGCKYPGTDLRLVYETLGAK